MTERSILCAITCFRAVTTFKEGTTALLGAQHELANDSVEPHSKAMDSLCAPISAEDGFT